jgi:KEOPS complex subunit Cgi121
MRVTRILGKSILIIGLKDVRIKNIQVLFNFRRKIKKCLVQFFRAELIAGYDHLYFAILNALKTFENKTNISKKLEVEILLFLSGQHQIKKAIHLLGIGPNSHQIVLLIISNNKDDAKKTLDKINEIIQAEHDDDVINLSQEKIKDIMMAYKLSNHEIGSTLKQSKNKAIESLLIEKGAILTTLT